MTLQCYCYAVTMQLPRRCYDAAMLLLWSYNVAILPLLCHCYTTAVPPLCHRCATAVPLVPISSFQLYLQQRGENESSWNRMVWETADRHFRWRMEDSSNSIFRFNSKWKSNDGVSASNVEEKNWSTWERRHRTFLSLSFSLSLSITYTNTHPQTLIYAHAHTLSV